MDVGLWLNDERTGERLKAHGRGNRQREVLFPASIDEYVATDAPVLAYDAFIEALDFTGFRRQNRETLGKVLKHSARLCLELDLIGGNTMFVDESKLRAHASLNQQWTKSHCQKRLEQIDRSLKETLSECERTDAEESAKGCQNGNGFNLRFAFRTRFSYSGVMTDRIAIEKKVLSENDRLAGEIRAQLQARRIVALNLVSSPGSGKTSLLEKTIGALSGTVRMALIAGDVQTENDANRLKRAGGKLVRPIVTGGACHLDAKMITRALGELDIENIDLLFIENVGNLVCPAAYDLGEDMKIVLISTTEGDDKPLKYPSMFRRSSAMVINKIDLMGFSEFDLTQVRQNALCINGNLHIFETSCRTGAGLDSWYDWLERLIAAKHA